MEQINKKELSKLFIEIKGNNRVAFERLYSRYYQLVYGIAFSIVKNKQDAEDIAQTVFAKIYTMEKSKLPTKHEASWLYSITKNETINFLKKSRHNISLEDIYEIEDNNDEINCIIDKESYDKRIRGLSNKEKEIISLKVLANLSFDEIGKMLEIPTGTVKWKYYKSLHTLEILLSNLGMFMITAILSVISFKNKPKAVLPIEPETNIIENDREDVSQTPPKEETQKQENVIVEENSKTQESIIYTPTSHSYPYLGVSFMGISIIFLMITVIFFIIFTKHQLKARKKLSK